MTPLFPPAWFAAGVVTVASAADFARIGASEPLRPVRHWRWTAFRDWSEEREALTPNECRAAYELGAGEPDTNLGTAMMCHAILQRNCPPEVREAARQSDRPAVRRTASRRAK